MKKAALLLALLLVGGCVTDAPDGSPKLGSTSSRRHVNDKDSDNDAPEKMCQDTSIGGESKTVCY